VRISDLLAPLGFVCLCAVAMLGLLAWGSIPPKGQLARSVRHYVHDVTWAIEFEALRGDRLVVP
jgi:hypothetical protein